MNDYFNNDKNFAKNALLHKLQDRIDHICNLVDLELSGQITKTELVKRLTNILKKEKVTKC